VTGKEYEVKENIHTYTSEINVQLLLRRPTDSSSLNTRRKQRKAMNIKMDHFSIESENTREINMVYTLRASS
jgi:hypothetical protein